MSKSDEKDRVVLVDADDNPVGAADKLAAHKQGLCHRAFSIFIFRPPPPSSSSNVKPQNSLVEAFDENTWQVLLQKRSLSKYHSPDLWSNTCCSHPRPNEPLLSAGQRRLQMEMGFSEPLEVVGNFHYRVEFGNGLIEDEIDHVLVGFSQLATPPFNTDEVSAIRWCSIQDVYDELAQQPEQFTVWLKQGLVLATTWLTKAYPGLNIS